MIKKICFVGNFEVPFSSENEYLWTFRERLDIEVIPLQERGATAEQIEQAALESDAFFWVHTHGWTIPGKPMKEVLANLKAHGVPTFGYHLDLWLGIDRQKELEIEDYWLSDYFFTVDKHMADYMNTRDNMPKAFFIRAGVVERDCYLGKSHYELDYTSRIGEEKFKKSYDFDVVFTGSRNYHPEWQYRPKLIDWLKNTYSYKFAHFGGDGLGTIRESDLNNLYARAKIVIGDTLCINYDYPYYLSDRVFETTGRGGFIIHPRIKGLEEAFEDGKEIIFYDFDNFDQLKRLIDYYISHDDEREKIRLAGHERTKRNHTYTNRLREIINILEGEIA